MTELRERIRNVLEGTQLAALATTTEEGRPWVRYVMATGDADLNIRFATFDDSRKANQIRHDPEVHLTLGVSDLANARQYLQIAARAEVTRDEGERHGFWHDQLRTYFSGPDDERYAIVVVRPYRIELMTITSREPEVFES